MNQRKDLQNMVLDVFSGNDLNTVNQEKEKKNKAFDSLFLQPGKFELLQEGRKVQTLTASASKKKVRDAVIPLAARFSAVDRCSEIGCGPEIFAALADFENNPNKERENLLRVIQRSINRLELAIIINSQEDTLSFLGYIWGEELAEKLAALTGSKENTVDRWIKGKHPTIHNRELIVGAALVLFQLNKQCGMEKEKATRYFEEVSFANTEDKRLRHCTLWEWISEYIAYRVIWYDKKISFPKDLKNHIVDIGGDGEVFLRDFRYRFLF